MSDLGLINSCIGFEITRNNVEGTVFMSQEKYIGEILEKYGM